MIFNATIGNGARNTKPIFSIQIIGFESHYKCWTNCRAAYRSLATDVLENSTLQLSLMNLTF
jgi:hypothetical protein